MNLKLVKTSRYSLTLLAFILSVVITANAQMTPEKLEQIEEITHSYNGWQLSAHGTIKVLLLYVEIEYDVNPSKDAYRKGSEFWKPGELPVWADDVFDPVPYQSPKATMSRYYNDCSLGNLTVLGDYWFEVITIKESEVGNLT
jgi:hypothetical protein